MARVQADDPLPQSTDPRLKIELYAENPQVVTPTGIDVDSAGRVWVIESNTHFPPEGYKGHPTDRILIMQGRDDSGRVKEVTVFKDGLTHSMSVAVKPIWLDIVATGNVQIETASKGPLEVFIATRREILLCVDTDGDLKCDKTIPLVHLETAGNYPHNGLAGFAFDPLGYMYFGFGENLGADYKVIGSDGTTLAGGGEGGNVYRCRPDGTKLEHWATGFWNPHASCIDAFGHLFSVDNDPDSRPPCRLLHVVQGGDYGYRFRNGRKGTHPFTAWNGEIPGTLPMVSGTGEAPSGILAYESDGFPKDYVGTLLVGSWGDHRIDKFVLKPRGISFESMPQPVIKGSENFRPVGLAVGPDGSLYFSDWVSKEYKLHGLGRVWRVSAVDAPKPRTVAATSEELLRQSENPEKIELSCVLVERRVQARKLAQTAAGRNLLKKIVSDERSRVEALWALANVPDSIAHLDLLLNAGDPALFRTHFDSVTDAASDLLATPQFKCTDPNLDKVHELVSRVLTLERAPHLEPYFSFDHQLADAMKLQLLLSVAKHRRNSIDWNDPFVMTMVQKIDRTAANEERLLNYFRTRKQDVGHPANELFDTWMFLVGRKIDPQNKELVKLGAESLQIPIRRAAVQWIGEEKLKDLRPYLEKALGSEPMNGDLFMACLASLSLLDGVPPAEFEKAPPTQHILPILKDSSKPASLRAIALRILPPATKELDGKLLGSLVASSDPGLRTEAIRTLGMTTLSEREELLRNVAKDEAADAKLRADAVAGLANPDPAQKLSPATRELLIHLATKDKSLAVQLEAIRSLRGQNAAQAAAPREVDVNAALAALRTHLSLEPATSRAALSEALDFATGNGQPRSAAELLSHLTRDFQLSDAKPSDDAIADGRRTFYQVNGAGCYKCHTIGGRGGQVGPDLTVIAQTMNREKLAQSILEPSREISPQFTAWSIETTSGKVLTGMLLGEEVNGDIRLGNNQGEIIRVPFKEIESRTPLKTSIMPEKLHDSMTLSELKDLISYLSSLK